MSTPVSPSRRRSRVPAPGAAALRQPVDRAKVGRGSVRRRATGMTATEAAAALEDARLQQHLDRDREDLAADERGPAEVGEWERIAQLLATTGGTYDPASDAAVQDELAAEAAAAAEAERLDLELEQDLERQEQLHSNGLPERAHLLMALEKAGLLGTTGTHYGAEGPLVLHEPEDRHALDYLNEYGEFYEMFRILEGYGMAPPRDPDAVPASVRAHSALLRAMAKAGTLEGFDVGHAVRLAQADPAAVLALAAWIEARGRSSR
ncbi:hypothetical protein [Streptomyces sp. ITFR-16]|uniref:hypothetical protein n=1 Tax=Streptomyces sp. ITFR-16 TaxID=3075198 RepID=UPI00288B9A47|nr:hypothetical protein [Streptomyces sp. ITFR-16]WNI27291.1 hypothetical protein RLT58_35735 [Streptomyces sp. ITFR-16]